MKNIAQTYRAFVSLFLFFGHLFFGHQVPAQTVVASRLDQRRPASTSSRPRSASTSVLDVSDPAYLTDEDAKPVFVTSARRLLVGPELDDASPTWIEHSLEWTEFMLERFPPTPQTSRSPFPRPERLAALIRLDDVFHIDSAPQKPEVQQFFLGVIDRALQDMETHPVRAGLHIWKLYNHGFLVRSPSVTVGFDIVEGTRSSLIMSDRQITSLAQKLDVLFISHEHIDHASKRVVRAVLSLHKTVIAPPGLWSNDPEFAGKLKVPERIVTRQQNVILSRGRRLRFIAYPGHQGGLNRTVVNNVYLVTTPEGATIAHTGDQSSDVRQPQQLADFVWMDAIARHHHVDVLLVNAWAPLMARILQGFDAALVITGHENEVGHTISHREGYLQTFERFSFCRRPYIVLSWGESCTVVGAGKRAKNADL